MKRACELRQQRSDHFFDVDVDVHFTFLLGKYGQLELGRCRDLGLHGPQMHRAGPAANRGGKPSKT